MYNNIPDIPAVKTYLLEFQKVLTLALQQEDGGVFKEDTWERPQGGGGRTRILEDGAAIERAGVNYSHVFGDRLPPSASAARPHLAGCEFEAMGVSAIVHPRNPFVPTSHVNLRFFVASSAEKNKQTWWFGGGFDLTPYYGFDEDAVHWHTTARAACDSFGKELYPRFKKWCDDYFFIKHRNEARGIGGLFFDDFDDGGFENGFAFLQNVGNHYLPAYLPIFQKRKDTSYGKRERAFQLYRRGRYVEFNLVYDRGTLFGLQSGGRTESILVSMPPKVSWKYDWQPEPDSPEFRLKEDFLTARDWVPNSKD